MTIVNVLERPLTGLFKKRQRKVSRLGLLRTAFRTSSYQGLRAIHCQREKRGVVLRGKVLSYFLKQMAQELVFKVLGRVEIRNEIEVEQPERVVFLS